MTTISEHFATVADPRVERTKLHPLINIITIALCGMISPDPDHANYRQQPGLSNRPGDDCLLS